VETQVVEEVEQGHRGLIHQDLLEDLEELGQEQFLDHQQHHQVLLFMVVEAVEPFTEVLMVLEDLEEDRLHLEQQQLILEAEVEQGLLEVLEELGVLEELL
jgi:hypothetical protein